MRPFRYLGDRLFLVSCALYALNRWLLKPSLSSDLLHSHFNDALLIPCALPLFLLLHRKLGLRHHDGPPTPAEIALHLLVWSLLFEVLGPLWMVATADPRDVAVYIAGGILAGLWWNRRPLATTPRFA